MFDQFIQTAILVLTVTGVILIARKNKWGIVSILLAQPFWFIASYVNGQWGVFLVTVVVTISWSYGVYNWFYNEDKSMKKGFEKGKP